MRPRPLIWIVALGLWAAPSLLAQTGAPSVDPKGRFAVYLADAHTDGVIELFLSDLKSGGVRKLNSQPVLGGDVDEYLIDAKGRYVVYRADQDADEVFELYRSSLVTGVQLKLSGPMVNGGDVETYSVDPSGRYAVYRADQDVNGVFELYRSDLHKGLASKLNGPLVPDGDVANGYRFDPKGRYVVYTADQDTDGVLELYRNDLKSGEQLKLSGPMVTGGNVAGFTLGPKSRYVVYRADQETDGIAELYRSDLKTGAQLKLSGSLPADALVYLDALIDPKGRHAVYFVHDVAQNRHELWSSDLVSGARLKLNGELVDGGTVTVPTLQLGAKGRYVVYVAEQDTPGVDELYRGDLKTGQSVKLSGAMGSGGEVTPYGFVVDPKGRYVVYRADQTFDEFYELFRSDLKTGAVVKLSGPYLSGADVYTTGYGTDPKGRYALFLGDQTVNGVTELFASDLKTGSLKRMNGPLPFGAGVGLFQYKLDPKGRHVVYQTDQESVGQFELYRSELKTAEVQKLSPALTPGGSISAPQTLVDPKGRYAVYVADQDTDEVRELYRSLLSNGSNMKLSETPVTGGDVILQ